jgi:hypothetical protein
MRIHVPVLAAAASLVLAAAGFCTVSPAVASATSASHALSAAHRAAPLGTTNNACYQSPSAKHCDNSDPLATDCSIGSYVASSQPVYYYDPNNGRRTGGWTGYVQNWYSPHCGTNWARYVDTSGAWGSVYLITCLTNSGHCTDGYDSSVFPAWSNQLYARTTAADALAQFSPGPARGVATA